MSTEDSLEHILEKYTSEAAVRQISRERKETDMRPKKETRKRLPSSHPQAELDLHGLSAKEAQRSAEMFLKNAKQQNLHLVRIITGKGLHSSQGQPVLRQVIEEWLTHLKHHRSILGFKWEKGKGSVLVYLV